ncbi:MAG: hypothetical protein R3253_00825 [Longimicrobiales bacterium]|nr:hypothetical protein [Longimicrobiales bacterium]
MRVEAAKEEVRRRLDRRRETPVPTVGGLPRALGRAAALVLLAAGAIYALPGSPVRDWISGLRSPEAASMTAPAGEAPAESIEVSVPTEGLRIAIVTAVPGQVVEVTLADTETASVTAPAGTRYSVSAETARAEVTEGVVRVVLPRGGGPIIVELDGRMVLRSGPEGLEVLATGAERDGDTILISSGSDEA